MSNAIRSPVGIVLVVFVAMVGRPLACRAVNAPYFRKLQSAAASRVQPMVVGDNRSGRDHRELDHHQHNIFSPKEGHHFMDARAEGAKRLERSKAKEKQRQKQLGQYKQDLQRATKERQREVDRQRERIERIQNEAADRQFERLVLSRGQHRMGDRVDAFCNVPKAKVQYIYTSTASPRTETTAQAAPTCRTTKCASDGTNGRLTEVKRLLKILRRMKKRAGLIIKTLNALDSEIVKCWPATDNRDASAAKIAYLTTSPPPQVSTRKTMKCWEQESPINTNSTNVSKAKERLEPPTPTPAIKLQSQHSRGFYFGLNPPGDINTKENVAAALQEERKLEQKVREEYQIEQANYGSEKERLREKLNRANYESAPAAAARLEYVLTNPKAKQLVMNGKALPKTQISQMPAAKNNKMSGKRNLLRRQYMNISKSKRNQQVMFGAVQERRSAARDQILSQIIGNHFTHRNKIHYK